MIVSMKKITLLVQSKDAPSTITKLRSLGVLHIEHQQLPQGKDINKLGEEIALINQALGVLSEEEFTKDTGLAENRELSDWRFTAHHIIDLRKRYERLKEYSRSLKARINQWQAWGDFDPKSIKGLSEKGIYVRLYQIPVKQLKDIPSSVIVKKISSLKGVANCLIISREKSEIPFKELALPKMGLEKMRMRVAEDLRVMGAIKDEIQRHIAYRESLRRAQKLLKKQLEFQEVLKGMGQSGEISYLSGYAPYDVVNSLQQTAKREKWGIVIREPSTDDRVPTLIRNPRWVSIIRPVFKLMDVMPGYRELDISLWFLIFFSIFFGMLIGDAGYGAIFFMLTLFTQKKWGKKFEDKSVFILFYILSFCAIIWGALTGTFFGQEWLPEGLKPLIPALRESRNIQAFCFLLGATHLSIAHLWRAIIKLPSFKALAEAGWILILWGAFFLAKLLILGDNFPKFAVYLFIAGASLVLFFTNPRKNIIKSIGAGLGNLFLNLVNSFTDIVSYIRLFAVGLATVAIADSFNKMALAIGFNSVITSLFTCLILLLGHTLNIILGPMSILVHGVRLNVLEFCNHLDIKWKGFLYKPLKEEAVS